MITRNKFVHAIHELLVIVVVGSIPAFLTFLTGGAEGLKIYSSMLPTDDLSFAYFMLFPLAYTLAALLAHLFNFNANNNLAKNSARFLISLFWEGSAGFLNLYRLLTGAAISYVVLSWIYEQDVISKLFMGSVIGGIVFFWGICCVLSYYHQDEATKFYAKPDNDNEIQQTN